MKKKISRKQRKIFLMLIVVFITAVTLAVETYAWFVGLSTASTGDITIAISSADGLELSLNGQYWTSGANQLKIKDSSHTYITETGCSNANCAYSGHKNKWPTSLEPVSSAGYTDTTTGRLNIFRKKSLVSKTTGYYITSEKINNSVNEGDGYVAFDLFIRNGKGSAYNGSTYNVDAEEDIYLTPDSFATTVVSGSQPDYGAANSLRVGFFEIARVKSSGYTVSNITNATCSSTTSGLTTLCINPYMGARSKKKNIWEPNHASHTTQMVDYYNQHCVRRSQGGNPCQQIDTGSAKMTHPMQGEVNSGHNVNIYDGYDLNDYYNSAVAGVVSASFETYKTSDATAVGNDKISLLKLAGNSITKVRVYIWLEGQDIDNFDIISKNPSIQVKFGLTKDRFAKDTTNTRPSSFQDDSWETIQYNVQHNNTSQYNIGDMKTITIDDDDVRMRLVNKSSSDSVCSGSTNSQTACGFVVEMVDSYKGGMMKSTDTNVGGYPTTIAYTELNGSMFNKLPDDLRSVITTTRVVSGHGSGNSSDFTSANQKLYLLSAKEIYGTNEYDTAASKTRQLDYYANNNVTFNISTNTGTNYDRVIRRVSSFVPLHAWLRTAKSNDNTSYLLIDENGTLNYGTASIESSIIPAFRIG